MKKLFALLLAVIMVLGLVACNVTNDNPTTDPKDNTTAGGNNTTGGDGTTTAPVSGVQFPLKEEVTFRIVASPSARAQGDVNAALQNNKLWQDLYKRTNVKIEIIPLTGEDRIGALNGLIQAGSQGDACFGNGITDNTTFSLMVANGLIMPLDEYVDDADLMPNLHERVFAATGGEAKGIWTLPDGHIYSLSYLNQNPSNYLESALWINKAWLDKAKMDIPETFEELEAALEYFKNNDMNGNGDPNDEIPYMCWQQFGYMTLEPMLGMWGISTKDTTNLRNCYVKDGKVFFAPFEEAWKDFIITMNEWWEKGWMYEGCFTDDVTTQKSHWSGEGLSEIGLCTYNSVPPRNSDEYVCITPPAAIEGVDVEWMLVAGANGSVRSDFFIFKDCENADILMAFMDQFYSWEVTQRNFYGETDSVYCMETAEGKILELTPNADAQEANFKVNSKLSEIFQNLPRAVTEQDLAEKVEPNDSDIAKQMAYDLYADYLTDEPWPLPMYSEENVDRLNEIMTDVFAFMRGKRAAWITGKADIESEYEAFKNKLMDMGVEEVVEIMQEAYDNYLEGMK